MTSFKTTFVIMTALLVMAVAEEHTGMGTAYSGPHDMDATGQNMCEYNPSDLDDKWQVYYGAMNEADWNAAGGTGDICGRCIRVKGVEGETTPGFKIKPVIVKIVDQCPDWACDPGNVDFSTTALEAITGYNWDKKKIVWDYIDCNADPVTGKTPDQIAAEKAAAAKKAIAADIKATAPSIEIEAMNALNAAHSTASAAELVTPEIGAIIQTAAVPVETASQVVNEVAQQAQQALEAAGR